MACKIKNGISVHSDVAQVLEESVLVLVELVPVPEGSAPLLAVSVL